MDEDEAPGPVEVRPDDLSPAAFAAIVEEFVTREGTDYGHQEASFDDKLAAVRTQIARGEARIVFDPATESVNILRTES